MQPSSSTRTGQSSLRRHPHSRGRGARRARTAAKTSTNGVALVDFPSGEMDARSPLRLPAILLPHRGPPFHGESGCSWVCESTTAAMSEFQRFKSKASSSSSPSPLRSSVEKRGERASCAGWATLSGVFDGCSHRRAAAGRPLIPPLSPLPLRPRLLLLLLVIIPRRRRSAGRVLERGSKCAPS